jgi:hypothetical protein
MFYTTMVGRVPALFVYDIVAREYSCPEILLALVLGLRVLGPLSAAKQAVQYLQPDWRNYARKSPCRSACEGIPQFTSAVLETDRRSIASVKHQGPFLRIISGNSMPGEGHRHSLMEKLPRIGDLRGRPPENLAHFSFFVLFALFFNRSLISEKTET